MPALSLVASSPVMAGHYRFSHGLKEPIAASMKIGLLWRGLLTLKFQQEAKFVVIMYMFCAFLCLICQIITVRGQLKLEIRKSVLLCKPPLLAHEMPRPFLHTSNPSCPCTVLRKFLLFLCIVFT